MKKFLKEELNKLENKYGEICKSLEKKNINIKKLQILYKKKSHLEPFVKKFLKLKKIEKEIFDLESILADQENNMKNFMLEEVKELQEKFYIVETSLMDLFVPKDKNDMCNTFLEIRAATGGKEAAIFSGDLFRMYSKMAEQENWKKEILNKQAGDHGGFKEIITKFIGKNVYEKLKFESGVHRVQRIPNTESQGRIHTSTCTVAVLPEVVDKETKIMISSSDVKIDTFKASGAGGQHVNKTDSAIRITHLESGIVVECQNQRSQHKNKAEAMSILKSKLLQKKTSEEKQKQDRKRKILVGSGERSERIRTYNYPQGRITDHRINLTLYKLEEIMEGNTNHLFQELKKEYQKNLMSELSERNV